MNTIFKEKYVAQQNSTGQFLRNRFLFSPLTARTGWGKAEMMTPPSSSSLRLITPHSRSLLSSSPFHPSNFSSSSSSSSSSGIRGRRRLSSAALRQVRSEVSFSVGTHLIPHPAKVDRGGEDAFLVSSYNGGVIAIADGVSGWAEQNINPALFSQELMANALNLVMDEKVNYDPQILLEKAHAATSSIGSATVIVAMLEKNGILKIANVGDCGLRVLRTGQVIFSTQPQEHYFDCPYQLSSEIITQTYRDAMVSTVELMEGDTIVMGSDGLFDNLFDHEIISTLSRVEDVVAAAKALAGLAHNHSRDPNFDSPYVIEARSRGFDIPLWRKLLGRKLTGGKPDDITVIVGKVVISDDQKPHDITAKKDELVD